jgi:bifunctional DNA-binding transcriptional regulator/antitoxin component of YhaV-PrlF toxin-antitoxin module
MSTKRVSSVEQSSTLEIQEDPVTSELYIELPQRLLAQLGWKEGDDLEWVELENGSWSVKKVENDEDNEK